MGTFPPGLPPLPPGTKYGINKFDPKNQAEVYLVWLYKIWVHFPRGCRPFPQVQNLALINLNQKIWLKLI